MRKINLKRLTFILVFINVIFFIGINYFNYFKPQIEAEASEERPDDETQGKNVYLDIMTTDHMVYNMCNRIVGGEHNVMIMFGDAEDENNFKINNDTLNNVAKKDLFIYAGKGNELWLDNFIEKLKKGKVGIIDLSRGTKTINNANYNISNGKESKYNIYYWLSPDEYKISLYNMKNAIQERDIKNRDLYEKNYDKILSDITDKEVLLQKSAAFLKDKKVVLIGDDLEYLIKYLKVDYTKIPENITDEDFEKKLEEIYQNDNKNDEKIEKDNNSLNKDNNIVFIVNQNQESDIIKKRLSSFQDKVLNIKIDKSEDYIKYLGEVNDTLIKLKQNYK